LVNIGAVFDRYNRAEANFLFGHNGVRIMTLFNHRVSLLAAFLMLSAIVSAILTRSLRRSAPGLWWSLAALCALSSLLMVRFSAPVWRTLPELHFVQFPWRWLFPLCTAVVLLLTFAVSASKRARVLWPAVGVAVIAVTAAIVHTKHWYPHFVDEIAEDIQAGRGYPGLPEYTPLANNTLSLPKGAPLVSAPGWHVGQAGLAGAAVYVERWSAERKEVCVELAHPMAIGLKLLAYPGWSVTVDGKAVALQANPQTGQVQLSLPAGASRIDLRFKRTPDRSMGIAISLVTAGLWGVGEFLLRRRKVGSEEREPELADAA
jgi:hypothetical protein